MKVVNRVDHIAWLCRSENLEAYVEKLKNMLEVKWDGPHVREHWGIVNYVSWSSGLEILSPIEGSETPHARQLNDHLEQKGEGLLSVVLGVRDIRRAVADARSRGIDAQEPFSLGFPHWTSKLGQSWEAIAGDFMNTMMVYGPIDYKDGVLPPLEE